MFCPDGHLPSYRDGGTPLLWVCALIALPCIIPSMRVAVNGSLPFPPLVVASRQ
jgi:hypothetical protein